MIYDLIIVGGSAAALSAGIYAARRRLNFTIITKDIGGEVAISGDIFNYPGFTSIKGMELSEKLREHLAAYEAVPETGITVNGIENIDQKFVISASKYGKEVKYESKSVIIATGVRPKRLNIPGEDEFERKGVSYCTVCDGPLFRNKKVAVIGGGESALKSGLMLSGIASRVYLLTINPDLKGDLNSIEKIKADKNIELIANAKVTMIKGEQFVKELEYINNDSHEAKKIALDGVFVNIGASPNSGPIPQVKKNQLGEIMVDSLGRTSIDGLFAAGDVTDHPYKQIIIASGSGVTAALAAIDYLNKLR